MIKVAASHYAPSDEIATGNPRRSANSFVLRSCRTLFPARENRLRSVGARRSDRRPPESRRCVKEFHSREQISLLSSQQSRHAAGEILIRLKIGEDEFLRVRQFRFDPHECAARAHIDRSGTLLEGFVALVAVEKHRDSRRNSRGKPLVEIMWRVPVARLAPPARQNRFDAFPQFPHE
jgi:hypothetical protein